MAIIHIAPGVAALAFGFAGGIVGFFIAFLIKGTLPGRIRVLISATIAGISAELVSGALGSLSAPDTNAVVLTSRLIGLLVGGGMFRFTFKGEFGETQDWLGPYMASSFASWTAFAMSHQINVIGLTSTLSAVVSGFAASMLGRAISRFLPSTLEQASAITQVAGLSWLFGFVSYSVGIVFILIATGKNPLSAFGIFAASSVALLISFIVALPYISSAKIEAKLNAGFSTIWKYNFSFILLFLFVALMILIGYQKAFAPIFLVIAVIGGIVAGILFGTFAYFLSREKRAIPPVAFSAVLLGVSTGQGIGVVASLSIDTFVTKFYQPDVLELVIISGISATIVGFILTWLRVRHKQPEGLSYTLLPQLSAESAPEEMPQVQPEEIPKEAAQPDEGASPAEDTSNTEQSGQDG